MLSHSSNRLAEKVCLVTGAGRGIGRNIARAMGHEGGVIALVDVDPERGNAVKNELGSSGIIAEFFLADLNSERAPRLLVDAIVQKFGRLDIIVNNARAGKRLGFIEETEENWDLAFGVNLKAVFFLAQAAMPIMPFGGSIVTISSLSGILVSQESPSYQISKAGLVHLTRYLASCGGVYGLRANAILPGFIVQDEHRSRYGNPDNAKYMSMTEKLHPLKGGPGYSDDIASAAIFLASIEASFITGQSLVVDGGLSIQDPTKLLFSNISL